MKSVAKSLQNPLNFYQGLPVKNIGEIFQSDSLSIGAISKILGDENHFAIRALLNVIIDDTVGAFNVGKTMNGAQLVQTAELVVEDFKHFKPEDFKKCFSNAKKGYYGTTYDRIDVQVIFEWLRAYDLDRDGEIESIRANQNHVFKMAASLPIIPKLTDLALDAEKDLLFKSNMEKLKANLKGNKIVRQEENNGQPVNDPMRSIRELCQRWTKQFDTLWLKRKIKGRFVRKYGRVMDINEYMERKHWQYNLSMMPKEKRQKEYLKVYPGNA